MTDKAFARIYYEFMRPLFFRMRPPYRDFTDGTDEEYADAEPMLLLMDGHGSHIYDDLLLTQSLRDKACGVALMSIKPLISLLDHVLDHASTYYARASASRHWYHARI